MDKIIYTTKPDMNSLPGGWEPKRPGMYMEQTFPYKTHLRNVMDVESLYEGPFIIHNLFSLRECDSLKALMYSSPNFEGVSIQGRKDIPDDRIGSKRTTIWSPFIAELFNLKFAPYFTESFHCDPLTPTDWWQGNRDLCEWEYNGISPMLRFMEYGNGGQHYAHYDAGFIYPDQVHRTLYSFVLYLSTNLHGGATRFIEDGQCAVPIWDRTHDDWIRPANDEEVMAISKPIEGNVLVFPHRMCHDVEPYTGKDPRIILRGDVLFRART
jgi:hypothetical protein